MIKEIFFRSYFAQKHSLLKINVHPHQSSATFWWTTNFQRWTTSIFLSQTHTHWLDPNCTIINFPMCSQNILWMDGKHFYGSSSPAFDARRCNSKRHYSRSSAFSPADCTPDRSHHELPPRRKVLTGTPKLPQHPIPWSRRKNCRAKNYSSRWVFTRWQYHGNDSLHVRCGPLIYHSFGGGLVQGSSAFYQNLFFSNGSIHTRER